MIRKYEPSRARHNLVVGLYFLLIGLQLCGDFMIYFCGGRRETRTTALGTKVSVEIRTSVISHRILDAEGGCANIYRHCGRQR